LRKTAYLRASVRVVGRAVADAILRLAVRVEGAAGDLYLGRRGRRRRDLRVGVSELLSTRLVEAGLVVLLDVVRGLGGERRGSHGRSSGGTEASAKGIESVAARHRTGEGRGTDKEGELSTKRWTNGMRGEAHKKLVVGGVGTLHNVYARASDHGQSMQLAWNAAAHAR
jgi:hypothetical protein